MLFSIIIANYNKADNIQALLSSIFDSYPYDDFELFFMDDASTDSSVNEANNFPARIYSSEKHIGPAALRNLAAKDAKGEFLLFVDSDVILPPASLENFRNLCLTQEFAAVLGLEVLPPVIDNWIGNFRTLQVQDNWGEYRTKQAAVEAWGTTFGAIRRDLFLKIGGFNESYKGADVEDHELAAKIEGGQTILFSPNMTYRHSYSGAFELMIKQFLRASQMMKIQRKALVKHSHYGLRFRVSHLLVAAAFAGSIACLFDLRWIYFVTTALVSRAVLNSYLLSQAIKVKGFVFAVYCFLMSLIMSLSIFAGAVYGKFRK
jgi:glycosyltransferase involved in cell wall biosynthesis